MTEPSLRTIDKTKSGCLLPQPQDWTKENSDLQIKKLSNKQIYTIPLFSCHECNTILSRAKKQFGFSSLDTYLKSQRDAERLCILDSGLATLLWNRLGGVGETLTSTQHPQPKMSFLKQLEQFQLQPFGFDVLGGWVPVSVNPCFRLSKYKAPSNGFRPHFDSQYCGSFSLRSILSIVIYLNQDIEGGETLFYSQPPLIEEKTQNTDGLPSPFLCPPVVSSLTTQEEINFHGGLQKYDCYSVVPETGKCILFPHDILHAGAPLQKGVKYVLRTDLVFVRNNIQKTMMDYTAYSQCLELFREAQNRELEGEVAMASDLYERALSLRRLASQKTNHDSSPWILIENIWMFIFSFLSMQDVSAFQTSRVTRALVQRYRVLFWSNIRYQLGLKNDPTHFPDGGDKQLCMMYQQYFIPKYTFRHGTRCFFKFPNSDFFHAHEEACLRVLAMSAICLFGQSSNAKSYIVQYDPVRQTVVQCSKEWLLTCAFYELPCSGTYFHLPCDTTSDVTKDNPHMDFSDEEKDSDEEESEDSTDSDKKESVWYQDNINEEEDDNSTDTKHIKKKRKLNDVQEISPTVQDQFEQFIDQHFLEHEFPVQQQQDFLSAKNHVQLFAFLSTNENKRKYQELWPVKNRKTKQSCKQPFSRAPAFSEVVTTAKQNTLLLCTCGIGGADGDEKTRKKKSTSHYNNLICDFSHQKLVIEALQSPDECEIARASLHSTGSEHKEWIAKLHNLNLSGYNHASCQCQANHHCSPSKEVSFVSHTFLDHMHLLQHFSESESEDHQGVEFITEYHGVSAL